MIGFDNQVKVLGMENRYVKKLTMRKLIWLYEVCLPKI